MKEFEYANRFQTILSALNNVDPYWNYECSVQPPILSTALIDTANTDFKQLMKAYVMSLDTAITASDILPSTDRISLLFIALSLKKMEPDPTWP